MDSRVEKRTWWGGKRRHEDRALTQPTEQAPLHMAPLSLGGPSVTPDNALAVADVFAAVRCLSDAAASIPLVSYRRTADGRTRDTGALSGLLGAPSPATTQANLIGQAVAHLNLYGNAYVGKFRDAEGRVTQLALLHPDRVTPQLNAGVPEYVVNDGRGRQSTHGTDDVIHVRALSTDGLIGLSPVRQCREALGLARGLAEHASAYFENAGRPSGILKVSGPAGNNREDMMALDAAWSNRHGGARNGHRIAVLSGDVEFMAVSGPLDDLQFVEQRHLSTAEIARIFRIPPWMLGATGGDSQTYSNVESQALSFVTYSLRPWLVLIEQAISADADLAPGSLYVEFLLDALLRADSRTRSEVYTAGLNPQTGWLTRAEVRRLENLEPEAEPQPEPTPEVIAL